MKTKPIMTSSFKPTALIAAVALLAANFGVQAAPRTWSGGAGDNNWGTAGNWGGTAPVSGDSLIFAGSTRVTNLNNIASLNLAGITFNNSTFLFGGNVITNSGGITDNAGNNTNNLVMYLSGSQSISNNVAATILQLGGINTNIGTGNILTYAGPGNIYVAGVLNGRASVNINGDGVGGGLVRLSAANLFAGPLSINSGQLMLANAAAIPNGIGFGDVTNNATLNMNGFSQTINGLFGSGTVDNLTGASTYTLSVGSTNNNGPAFFYGGTIQNTSGSIGLTKIGTNIFLLGGSPNYSGPTIVSVGTLALTNGASIPNSTIFTVSPGALFDFSQGSFTAGATTVLTAGRATNGGPADIIGNDLPSSGTINILSGAQRGTLRSSGGLSLSGGLINYDLGNTTVTGASSNDVIAINGPLNLSGSTTLRLNPVLGSFAVGNYTLITNQNATLTGTAAGNLVVQVPRGITATLDDATFPGSLLVNISGVSTPVLNIWTGAVNGDWDVNATANWATNGVADTFFNLDNVLFNDSTATATINIPVGVSPFSTLISNNSSNYIFAGSGAITGSGGLTKSGTATATFRNANGFTGNTVINNGALLFDFVNSGAVNSQIFYNGVTAGTLFLNGGTLIGGQRTGLTTYQLFGGTTLNSGGATVNQQGRTSNAHPAVYLGAITRNAGGTVDIQPNTGSGSTQADTTTGIFTTTANNNATASGIVGGYATWNAGEFSRVNASAGAQGGFHMYGGATYINLFANLTNTDMTASLSPVANTNTMSVRFNTAAANTLTLSGSNVITSGGVLVTTAVGANLSTITGGTALTSGNGQDLIVHQYDTIGDLLINSLVVDNTGTSIALTKTGGGKLILGGANTFTGPAYINAGTLQVGTGGAVGSIDNSTGVTNRGTLAFNRTGSVTFALPVSGSGGLSQLGSGIVTLTGNNSFSGATFISPGTLQVGNGGTVGSLGTSPSAVNNGSMIFNRSDSVSFAGPISGSGTLVNQGAGALTLGSTNAYTGATFVNGGKLVLGAAAAISNSAAIVLAGSTTLDVSAQGGITLFGGIVNQILAGTGTVNGSVTTSSGTGTGTRITPGTNGVVGTLTITNALTLNGGTVNMDVSTGAKDLIVVGGNLTLTSGTILLNVSGSLANGSYKLIGYSGSLSGAVGNMVVNGFSQSGQVAALSSSVAGEIDLVISAYVPKNLVWQGDGGGNLWDALTTADWTNSLGSLVVFTQNDNAIFNDTTANTTVNLTGTLTPTHITVNGTANSYTLQGGGNVAGGDLTINNPNTTTVLTANGYSGFTAVNAGTLQLGNGVTAGSVGNGNLTNNSAVIFNEPADQIVGSVIAGAGILTHSAANTLSLSGNNTMSGPVVISSGTLQVGVGSGSGSLGTSSVTNNGTLQISRSGSLTVSSTLTGTGRLIVDGPGTVTLSGANDYQANTYISNGVVKLGNASAISSGGASTGWLILDGGAAVAGKLDMNGFNQTVNALSGLTGTVLGQINNNGGSGTNTLTVNEIAATTFAGNIIDNSGSGGKVALIKNGPNALTLTSDGTGSSFTGGTLINDGIVSGGSSTTANATMLGTGPVIFGTNATLQLAGWAGSTTPGYNSLANPFIILSNYTATVLGCARVGGPFPSSVTGATNSTLIYVSRYVRGQMGGNWNGFLGTLIASNNLAGGGSSFPVNTSSGFPNTHVVLAPNEGMMSLVAGNPVIPIGELIGDATTSISLNSDNSGGQAVRWAVGGLNTTAQFDGSIGGAHGIIKTGTGTWTLTSATLNYSGLTTVSNGVLTLGAAANLSASTPITITAPGKLDASASGTLTLAAQTIQGNGTLNGSLVTGAGTTVSPGGANNIATLTITNAVTLAGTTLMELNRTNSPTTNDMIVAATVTAGGTLQVNNLGSDLHTGDTFKLFSTAVTGAFTITNLPVTTGGGGITYVWTNKLAIDGTIQVLVGVPNINTNAFTLTNSLAGNVLTLAWPTDHIGFRLQAQTNTLGNGLGGVWTDVAGATSVSTFNFTINPNNGTVFYRMVYP